MRITDFFRNLIKPKPNTIWDYVVPLSLISLELIVSNYSSTKTYEIIANNVQVIYLILVIFSLVFLTRFQRILIVFIAPIVAILLNILAKAFGFVYIQMLGFLLFILPIINIEYLIGNLSLLLISGNSPLSIGNKKKYSPLRRVSGYGVFGFGIDILYIYSVPFPIPVPEVPITHGFIFDGFNKTIGIPPLAPLFTIIFILFGYYIEKYKQRRESKK